MLSDCIFFLVGLGEVLETVGYRWIPAATVVYGGLLLFNKGSRVYTSVEGPQDSLEVFGVLFFFGLFW